MLLLQQRDIIYSYTVESKLKDVLVSGMLDLDLVALTADQRSDGWNTDTPEPVEEKELLLTRGGTKETMQCGERQGEISECSLPTKELM